MCQLAEPHALPHEVSTYIYIYIYIYIYTDDGVLDDISGSSVVECMNYWQIEK